MSGQKYGFWDSLTISNTSSPFGFTPSPHPSYVPQVLPPTPAYVPPPLDMSIPKSSTPFNFPSGPSSTSYVNAGINPSPPGVNTSVSAFPSYTTSHNDWTFSHGS